MTMSDMTENAASTSVTINDVKKALSDRDELDRLIADYEGVLASHGITLDTPLVDEEDYPLANVDIYAVRPVRRDLIRARNDRIALTVKIEKMLHELHSSCGGSKPPSDTTNATVEKPVVHRTSNEVFARIGVVSPYSPADNAGLRGGDCLIQFGPFHAGNLDDIKQMLEFIQDSIEKPIRLTVVRGERPIRLELTPRYWSGRGLLGCSVIPMTSAKII
ncbi:hypothetical protein AB6A40_006379 [Gnathostoma spinigerum]|uniref:Nas2 N-terminal domain-containing protein n=1 Tax=Gnathostoma spinigerum TaxID=75299 RepID=A0ABD6EI71_9BILA